jgi:hypothetical protein
MEQCPFTIRICEEEKQYYVAILFELHDKKEDAESQREGVVELLRDAGWDVLKVEKGLM